jgi:hypothetical protein
LKGSVRSRSKGTWELTVDLGTDANGKRRRKFVSVKGTKANAYRELRNLLGSLDKGLPLDSGRITVVTFLYRWLRDYVALNTRPRTFERYESDIRIHISPVIGHIQLTKLASADIQDLEARMLENGLVVCSTSML